MYWESDYPPETDEEIVLSSGMLDGCVEPRAMDEAMALSCGPLPGSEPTAAATPLSSGPPSVRRLGWGDAAAFSWLEVEPSVLPTRWVARADTFRVCVRCVPWVTSLGDPLTHPVEVGDDVPDGLG